MFLVDIVRSNILNDEKVANFVFGAPKDESVLSSSLAFPKDAIVTFHWPQPEITRRRMTRQILEKSLGPSSIIECEIFRRTLFVVLAILPACHRTIRI
jgi:hypothetical protein